MYVFKRALEASHTALVSVLLALLQLARLC